MEPTARRFYLGFALKLMALLGLLLLSIPFLASLRSPEPDRPARPGNPWEVDVDWSRISPGNLRVVSRPDGQEVWIYRRQAEDLQHLAADADPRLRDPESRHSRQPQRLGQPGYLRQRSLLPEVFVFLPYETSRGCRVQRDPELGLFVEPCHGARFDSAGRILRDSGSPQQQNLVVPNYELSGDNSLRLLPPGPR